MDMSRDCKLACSSYIRPCLGEARSGDSVVIRHLDEGLLVAIVDVLGHGDLANELTHVIDRHLERYGSPDLAAEMTLLHRQLKGSRGAALGLCFIDASASRLLYTGVGNTSIRRFGNAETRLYSQDGVLGQNMRTPRLQPLDLLPNDLVVMYTDGVSDRFTSGDYPGVIRHTPEQVAKNIVQRFGKDYDDAACVAIRCDT
jgi:negative regulator of sigma-B (phosphoserine phosphatase)